MNHWSWLMCVTPAMRCIFQYMHFWDCFLAERPMARNDKTWGNFTLGVKKSLPGLINVLCLFQWGGTFLAIDSSVYFKNTKLFLFLPITLRFKKHTADFFFDLDVWFKANCTQQMAGLLSFQHSAGFGNLLYHFYRVLKGPGVSKGFGGVPGEPWGFRLGRLGFTLGKIRGPSPPRSLRWMSRWIFSGELSENVGFDGMNSAGFILILCQGCPFYDWKSAVMSISKQNGKRETFW